MGDGWREHLEVNDAGTVTIKAHGRMKTDAKIVAVSCPFCSTMMSDGMTSKQKEIDVVDIAQMIEKA